MQVACHVDASQTIIHEPAIILPLLLIMRWNESLLRGICVLLKCRIKLLVDPGINRQEESGKKRGEVLHNATHRCFMQHGSSMDLFSYAQSLYHPPERSPVDPEYLGRPGLVAAGHLKHFYYIGAAHLFKGHQVFARHGRYV